MSRSEADYTERSDSSAGRDRTYTFINRAVRTFERRRAQEERIGLPNDLLYLQSATLIEDAKYLRDPAERGTRTSQLMLYRNHHRRSTETLTQIVVFLQICLTVFENPSQFHIREWICATIEFVFLSYYVWDFCYYKVRYTPSQRLWKNYWNVVYVVCLALSFCDVGSVFFFGEHAKRYLRLLRAFYIVYQNQLLRRHVIEIFRTLPHVLPVLSLILSVILLWATFSVIIFWNTEEGRTEMNGFVDAVTGFYVLITDSNFPDFMVPGYHSSRWYSLIFISFLIVANVVLLNLVLAVIYSRYEDFIKDTFIGSFQRRRECMTSAFYFLARPRDDWAAFERAHKYGTPTPEEFPGPAAGSDRGEEPAGASKAALALGGRELSRAQRFAAQDNDAVSVGTASNYEALTHAQLDGEDDASVFSRMPQSQPGVFDHERRSSGRTESRYVKVKRAVSDSPYGFVKGRSMYRGSHVRHDAELVITRQQWHRLFEVLRPAFTAEKVDLLFEAAIEFAHRRQSDIQDESDRHNKFLSNYQIHEDGTLVGEDGAEFVRTTGINPRTLAEIQYMDYMEFSMIMEVLNTKVKLETAHIPAIGRFVPFIFYSWPSRILRAVVKSKKFEHFVNFVILANWMYLIAVTERGRLHHDSPTRSKELGYIQHTFVAFYVLEILLKLYTYGGTMYLRKPWNRFDLICVTLMIVFEGLVHLDSFDSRWGHVMLLIRFIRVFRWFDDFKSFKLLLEVCLNLIPSMLTYSGILFALFYIFSIIGMEIFGGKIYPGNPKLDGVDFTEERYTKLNFNNYLGSQMTLFVLLITNDWQLIAHGHIAVTSNWAWIFFIAFHLLAVVIALNVVQSFIISAFVKQSDLQHDHAESLEDIINEIGVRTMRMDNYGQQVRYRASKKRKQRNVLNIVSAMFGEELADERLVTRKYRELAAHMPNEFADTDSECDSDRNVFEAPDDLDDGGMGVASAGPNAVEMSSSAAQSNIRHFNTAVAQSNSPDDSNGPSFPSRARDVPRRTSRAQSSASGAAVVGSADGSALGTSVDATAHTGPADQQPSSGDGAGVVVESAEASTSVPLSRSQRSSTVGKGRRKSVRFTDSPVESPTPSPATAVTDARTVETAAPSESVESAPATTDTSVVPPVSDVALIDVTQADAVVGTEAVAAPPAPEAEVAINTEAAATTDDTTQATTQ